MSQLHLALLFTACAALACSTSQDAMQGSGGAGGSNRTGGTGGSGIELSASPVDSGNIPKDMCVSEAVIALPADHRMASALYAISALEAGIAPDPALLRRDDFQRYFAPPSGSTPGSYGRFIANGTTEGMPQALLEAGVVSAAPATPSPVHLIVVVDESSSMREEIALAADLVDQMTRKGALGATKEDRLTVIEWTDEPVSLLANAAPKDGVIDTSALVGDLRKRASSQLAGAPSFENLRSIVGDAISASDVTSHVVVLTDGGFDLDTPAIATLEDWSARQAVVSVVELHGLAESSDDPMPYHPELGTAFSGGLDLFVGARSGVAPSDEGAVFHDRFGELFRVATQRAVGALSAPGFSLMPADPDAAAGDGSVRVGWLGDGGVAFVKASMIPCFDGFPDETLLEAGAGEGDPKRDAFTAYSFDLPPINPQSSSEARTLRMSFVDRIVDVLESKCDVGQGSSYQQLVAELAAAAQASGLDADALAEHQATIGQMEHWLTLYPAACQ